MTRRQTDAGRSPRKHRFSGRGLGGKALELAGPYREDVLRRFNERHEAPAEGCWPWTGSRTTDGYGQIKVQNQSRTAHRVSYALFKGPVAAELTIDHLCGNPWCVNPEHLEQVTMRENLYRGDTLAARKFDTHCKRGHEFTEENTTWTNQKKRGADGAVRVYRIRTCRECNLVSHRRSDKKRAAKRREYQREYNRRKREATQTGGTG